MHPLCLTIIRRPDLVVDHLSAYAALFQQEASQAGQSLVNKTLVLLIAVMLFAISLVLAGTALMLCVLQNQFHWILVAVPGTVALCALVAFAWSRQTVFADHFSNIKSQLSSDASALRAAGQKV